MRGWLLLLVAGCFQPSPPANAPCGPDGACPTGQRCIAGVCRTGDAPLEDAATDTAPVDMAEPVDAMPDAPNLSGCADGEREAFPSLTTHPTIAGCAASWSGNLSLRAAATNMPCGDDLGTLCGAPVDACAAGWHVCGTAGDPAELATRATQQECAEAGEAVDDAFVIAMTHCTSIGTVCVYEVPLGCPVSGTCGEPVCCGGGCRTNQGCTTAVYPVTAILGEMTTGCGDFPATELTGVLCCQ